MAKGEYEVTYAYLPNGLRLSKTAGAVTTGYVWDGDDTVLERTGEAVTAKYLRGTNLISSVIGGTTSYYLYNSHGDVVQLTNASGTVSTSYDYDAFGVERNPDDMDGNPFRYCGEYYDNDTGTYYLRARYYDPTIGRFLSEDSVYSITYKMPNGQEIIDPLSLNLYTYCRSNPVLYFDQDGHLPLLAITAIVGALIGGVWGGISASRNGGGWWKGALKGAAIGGVAGLTLGAGGSLVASFTMGGASVTLSAAEVYAGFSALIQGGAAATLWGVSKDGVNQGVRHFFEYATQYPGRLADIAKNLGVRTFEITKSGFTSFTNEAMNIVKNYQSMGGQMRQVGEKVIYYYNNVIVIMYDGKLQSMMTGAEKYFKNMK